MAYGINIGLEAPKNLMLEVIGSKRCSTSFYICVIEYVIVCMFIFTVNEATTSSY